MEEACLLYKLPVLNFRLATGQIIKRTLLTTRKYLSVTDALSTMLRLLGEELEAASWLIKARSRMEPVEPCDEE